MVGTDIKLPIFNANGLEDLKQHWFQCEYVWIVKQIQDKNIKKGQMITTLRGRALDWYMKFSTVLVGVVPKTLNEIRLRLIDEFKKLNSESQCITEIKEIKKLINESVGDFDQIFKTLMAKVSFQMPDVQHKEWFIATLFPHIRTLLKQYKLVSWKKALVMKNRNINESQQATKSLKSRMKL